ncbi:MAG TPA: hypothetical protein VNB64_02585 [Solirubrobacteraceae bacterium]|nr:hypothetical protein [Solirubrobacteraceae bacterium]
MTEAIFGLVGVVIGAGLTGGVQYVLAVREERESRRAVCRVLAERQQERR